MTTELTEEELAGCVADGIADGFAELDDSGDDLAGLFGELPRVGSLRGGGARHWFVVRHQTEDRPAIRITVEVEQ